MTLLFLPKDDELNYVIDPVVQDRFSGRSRRNLVFKGHNDAVTSVAFSPDNDRIVSGSQDKTIRVRDLRSGQKTLGPLVGHTDRVTSVAFSPNGNAVLSSSRDTTLRMWDADTGRLLLKPLEGHASRVVTAVFSPDGSMIASGADMHIRIWDVKTGKVIRVLSDTRLWQVLCVAFSPDGSRLVVGSMDSMVRIWDVKKWKPSTRTGDMDYIATAFAFSPDTTRFVCAGRGASSFDLRDTNSCNRIAGPFSPSYLPTFAVFSPDGKHLAAKRKGVKKPNFDSVPSLHSDRGFLIWDVTSKRVTKPLEIHTPCVVMSAAFAPDGIQIAAGCTDGTIRTYDC